MDGKRLRMKGGNFRNIHSDWSKLSNLLEFFFFFSLLRPFRPSSKVKPEAEENFILPRNFFLFHRFTNDADGDNANRYTNYKIRINGFPFFLFFYFEKEKNFLRENFEFVKFVFFFFVFIEALEFFSGFFPREICRTRSERRKAK